MPADKTTPDTPSAPAEAKAKHGGYAVKKQGAGRQFDSDFLEFFARAPGWLPLVIYSPVIAWLGWLGATDTTLGGGALAGFVGGGVFLWTLTEYWLHRTLFHWQKFPDFHYFIHGIHHEYPNDEMRDVFPPFASLLPAVGFGALFWLVLGYDVGLPTFTGFLAGYVWYDTTHWWTHVGKPKGRWGKLIREHHMRHHFQDPDMRFGVTSPLWDLVFGTYPRAAQPKGSSAA